MNEELDECGQCGRLCEPGELIKVQVSEEWEEPIYDFVCPRCYSLDYSF